MYDGNGNRVGYGESKKIVDVSSYNGSVDWATVKNSGIDGAIIRATSYSTGSITEDTKFNTNIKGARNVGLPVGIYLYSYATNPTEALNEANKLVEILNSRGIRPSNLTYPVYYDLERNSYTSSLSVSQYEQIVATFISRMEQAGFKTNIYSYTYYLNNNLNSPAIHRYVSWVAQYGKELTFKNNYYKGLYGWQYCSDGSVPGITGTVDISCFSDFYGYDTENTTNAITSKGISEPTLEYRANNETYRNSFGEFWLALKLYRSPVCFSFFIKNWTDE